jgi:hypothetical protein
MYQLGYGPMKKRRHRAQSANDQARGNSLNSNMVK